MTTDNGGGPISSDNQNAGNDAGGGAPDNSSGGNAPVSSGFAQALNADNLGYAQKKGWKLDDPNVVLTSYRELEKHNSTKLAEFAPPTNPTEYKFTAPDGVPSEGFINPELESTFRQWAHKAKVPAGMASDLYDSFVKHSYTTYMDAQKTRNTQVAETVTKAHDELIKAWGAKETPAFKQNVEMSRRAMTNLDPELKASLKSLGILADYTDDAGKTEEVVTNATIFKALAKAGASLYAEDRVFGARPQGENPFDANESRKPGAMQRQGEILRNDPELAKTLIKAAGAEKDWAHWLNKR